MYRIFIIEDDANILFSLQAQFSLKGVEVIAENGNSSVIEVANRLILSKPDFIILDLILPKFDGFDMLKQIKSSEELRDIPVFVFTNLSDQDSRNRGLNLGADFYLIKGELQINEAVDKILKIIKNKVKLT